MAEASANANAAVLTHSRFVIANLDRIHSALEIENTRPPDKGPLN
jgi:hypothetical protein